MTVTILTESRPGRLGRHVEHDERSKGFLARMTSGPIVSTKHVVHGPPFDQGELGSCTGNAAAMSKNTEPLFVQTRPLLTEADAVTLYERATHLDAIPGSYPPNDTGSSGLAVAKAALALGYIKAYRHAFGLQQAMAALVLHPTISGVNWYDSFDAPLKSGECVLSQHAGVRGGHEIMQFGLEVPSQGHDGKVWCRQSWGPTWGGLRNGSFWFSWTTFEALLAEQGDVTVLE